MFVNTPKEVVNTKPLKKYDLPFYSEEDKRKRLLVRKLSNRQYFMPISGTSDINPYKDTYDVIRAECRAELEYYNKSKIWATKYRPHHFKYFFCIPMISVFGFCVYLQYIHMPRNMIRLKEKHGALFLQNEKRGTFKDWVQEEYIDEIYGDIFQGIAKEEKTDKTLKPADDILSNANDDYRQKMSYKLNLLYAERQINDNIKSSQ
jgi:hypothetical protein